MKEFTLIFRLNSAAVPSPEQLAERLAWLTAMIDSNTVINRGNILAPIPVKTIYSTTVVVDERVEDTDSFFINGYLVIQAQSMDEAVTIAKTNPIFKVGGKIEVREVLQRAT